LQRLGPPPAARQLGAQPVLNSSTAMGPT